MSVSDALASLSNTRRGASSQQWKFGPAATAAILTFSLSVALSAIYFWNAIGTGTPKGSNDHLCICTMDFSPVCTVNGTTAPNRCTAKCQGLAVAYDGECTAALPNYCGKGCPDTFSPVCGHDRMTYLNDCVALCSGVQVLKKGKCSSAMVIKPRERPS